MDRHGAWRLSRAARRRLTAWRWDAEPAYSVVTLSHANLLAARAPALSPHRAALLPLLAIDLLLIGMHLASMAWPALFDPSQWSVEADRGVAEWFQYLKWALLGLCFAGMALRQCNAAYLAWTVVFGYLLADDWLQLHERAGRAIARHIDLTWLPYLRPRDGGELIASAAVGGALVLLLAIAWRLGGARMRRVTLDMAVLLAALAAFGVGIDALHSAVLHLPALSSTLGTVEDGGEMLVASLMLAYAVAVWCGGDPPRYADALRSRLARRR